MDGRPPVPCHTLALINEVQHWMEDRGNRWVAKLQPTDGISWVARVEHRGPPGPYLSVQLRFVPARGHFIPTDVLARLKAVIESVSALDRAQQSQEVTP